MKTIVSVIIIFTLVSCQEDSSRKDFADTRPVTSISEIDSADSLAEKSVETPEQFASDMPFLEFFGDFMFREEFQKKSIRFPLPFHNTLINSGKLWHHNPLYTGKSYMPILHSDTIMRNNGPSLEDVKASVVSFENQQVESFYFAKDRSGWMLTKVDAEPIDSLSEADFLYFLEQFSMDSLYQVRHVNFPLPSPFADDEKDFATSFDTLARKDWRHINLIEDIDGLLLLNETTYRTKVRQIHFRGIENGINVFFTFRKDSADWRLVKLEDYST